MILVGVDPGNITGIAVWFDPAHYEPRNGLPVDTAEVEAAATVPVLRRMLEEQRPTLVAVERYIQNTRKTHQPKANEVIGALKSFCEEQLVRCVYQSPAAAQKIGTRTRLRQLGWYINTKDNHANAALGHVLLLLAQTKPETYAELIGL